MKVVIFVCSIAAAALIAAGAPAVNEDPYDEEQIVYLNVPPYRLRRSSYGVPALPYGLPAYGPSPSHYGPSPSQPSYSSCGGAHMAYAPPPPHASYGYGHAPSYAPHYRSEDFMDTNMISFPDSEFAGSEHIPMARFGYVPVGPAAASLSSGSGVTSGSSGTGSVAGSVATGAAYSVFPNANVGGCSVPLLLSCSPSIVPGRMIQNYGAAPAVESGPVSSTGSTISSNVFRGVEDKHQVDTITDEDQPTHTKIDGTKDIKQ